MLLGMLTCKEALQRLDDFIDRELSPEEMERVRRHVRICHSCSRKFATEETFVQQMRAKLDRLTVPVELMRKITLTLAEENEGEQPGVG